MANRVCDAVRSNKLEMVKYIVSNWPNKGSDYRDELQCAMDTNNTKITKYLFSIQNKQRMSDTVEMRLLVDRATDYENIEQIIYLLTNFKKETSITKPDQYSVLQLIARKGTLDDFILVAGEKYDELFSQTISGNNTKIGRYLLENVDKYVKKEDIADIERDHHTNFATYLVRINLSSVVGLGHYEFVEVM